MTPENKNRMLWGAKVIALIIYVILTIATCAGVWNFCPEPFVKWCAGLLFAANGFIAYLTFKWIRKN